jgi:hypothetical protein
VHYLRFDGVDDAMATASIDFSASDEMSVFAGVRKLSDTAVNIIVELGPSTYTNSGSFVLSNFNIQGVSGPRYSFWSRGTEGPIIFADGYSSPTTNVVTGLSEITSPVTTLRVEGAQVASSVGGQGFGNYGNYPLYIGARVGTSLYFNGNLYGLTVRGALSDDPTVAKAEKLVAKKTGITL